ncbi:hypothetical protein BS47DRAFT_284211 [Hydnum rufescens UP504]|uniref:Uncharacterized protein n=1 Tax=Hydnum rufescens UP504 TaxID=1448309 RepID=A0A9P6AKT8_9AGAM|nr:hypothetical protein BS47DRAFT_284211 [Hydnum rufescens UP504]
MNGHRLLTSLATEGTRDPKDSPAYSASSSPLPYPHLFWSPITTISVSQSSPSSFAPHICTEFICLLLCVLRYILRPAILLHLVRIARGPEVPLISLTCGIHSRLFCSSHSRLLIFLTILDMGSLLRKPAK